MALSELGTVFVDYSMEGSLDVCIDAYFHNNDFQREILLKQGVSDISIGKWSKERRLGSSRDIEYVMPKRPGIPQNRVYINMKYTEIATGEAYQVDQVIKSPELPAVGKCFVVKLRTIVSQEKGNVRFRISQDVEFVKFNMLKGIVKKNAKSEGSRFYSSAWLPYMKESFRNFLQKRDPAVIPCEMPQESDSEDNVDYLPRNRAFSLYIPRTDIPSC